MRSGIEDVNRNVDERINSGFSVARSP